MKTLKINTQTLLIWLSITFSNFFMFSSLIIILFSIRNINFAAIMLLSFINIIIAFMTHREMKSWNDSIYTKLWPDQIETYDDLLSHRNDIFWFGFFLGSIVFIFISTYLSS